MKNLLNLFLILALVGCNKSIRLGSGKTLYQPSEKPEVNDLGTTYNSDIVSTNEKSSYFYKSANNVDVYGGKQNNNDRFLTKAVNNTSSVSKKSVNTANYQGNQSNELNSDLKNENKNHQYKSEYKSEDYAKNTVILLPAQNNDCNCQKKVEDKPLKKNDKKIEDDELDDTTKSYRIQCGNYINKKAADNLKSNLENKGFSNIKVVRNGNNYLVLMGSYNSKSEGYEISKKLENIGQDYFWVYR